MNAYVFARILPTEMLQEINLEVKKSYQQDHAEALSLVNIAIYSNIRNQSFCNLCDDIADYIYALCDENGIPDHKANLLINSITNYITGDFAWHVCVRFAKRFDMALPCKIVIDRIVDTFKEQTALATMNTIYK